MELSKTKSLLAILVIFGLISTFQVQSADILFFFAVSTYSHRIIAWPLVQKLVEAGHNVTFAQSYSPKSEIANSAVVELFPPELLEDYKKPETEPNSTEKSVGIGVDVDLLSARIQNHGRLYSHTLINTIGYASTSKCSQILKNPTIRQWLDNSKGKYDLLVVDTLFNECGYGIAYKLKISKVILFSTTSIFSWLYDEFGISTESSWISDLFVAAQFPINLYQRIETSLVVFYQFLYRHLVYFPEMDKILREGLQTENMPTIKALIQEKTKLMLVNTHFNEEFARNLPPFAVSIGGMQCDDSRQYLIQDKNLETFLNESISGFIYVSFGALLHGISTATSTVQSKFFNAFQTLGKSNQTRFVLSWKGPRPKTIPANVFTTEWLSQKAVLSHPNIKGFITHGGLSSLQEATAAGVPVIVFPIFAEQDYNAMRIKAHGLGIVLEIADFNEQDLTTAINSLPSYKTTMKQASVQCKDKPISSTNLGLYWVEYVLRNDERTLEKLKPLSMKQSWYERRQIDVGLVLFALFMLLGIVLVKILLFIKIVVKKLFETYRIAKKLKKQ